MEEAKRLVFINMLKKVSKDSFATAYNNVLSGKEGTNLIKQLEQLVRAAAVFGYWVRKEAKHTDIRKCIIRGVEVILKTGKNQSERIKEDAYYEVAMALYNMRAYVK